MFCILITSLTDNPLFRHSHIAGYKKGQTITGKYYTTVDSPYLAFPTSRGGINIVSSEFRFLTPKMANFAWKFSNFRFRTEKYKDHVDTVQSGTNSCVDCHFSKDGNRLWSLANNGEVMCFDLRQMRAINTFSDMFGATSLCKSNFSPQSPLFDPDPKKCQIRFFGKDSEFEDHW